MKKDGKGILFALLAALCFAAIPAMVKTAYAGGAGVLSLLAIRYILASAALVPATIVKERKGLPPLRLVLLIMLVAGIFLSLQAGLYFASLAMLPSSLAALILFTYPLIVNVAGLFFGGKLSPGSWLSLALCLLGLAALLGPNLNQLNPLGILFAFLAAVSYSVYLILIDKLIAGVSPAVTNAAVSLSNAIVMTAASLLTGTFSIAFQPSAWVAIALMVVISNVAGFQLFFKALKSLGPNRTSVLNMSEPLFTVLIAILFLGERLMALQAAGAFALVLGLFAFVYLKTKRSISAKNVEMGAV